MSGHHPLPGQAQAAAGYPFKEKSKLVVELD
jgi:hypothetical protein